MKRQKKSVNILFCFVLIFSLNLSAPVEAKIFYICAGANGRNDGSDWDNAFNSFSAAGLNRSSSTLPRGNIYYVGNGDYGEVRIENDVDGDAYITIKKATVDDHGTEVGWNPSFAEQAVFGPGTSINTSYVIWDGAVGSGDDISSYGFKIASQGPVDTRLFGVPYLGNSSLEMSHVVVAFTAFICWGSSGDTNQIGLYSNPARADSIFIKHNYFSGSCSNILMRAWKNSVIEFNYFDGNWSSPNHHGEQISPGRDCDDIVVRNNIFKDSSVFVIGTHKANNSRWKIYNNIVIGGHVSSIWANADSGTSNVMINWEIHNNTHVNVQCGGGGAAFVGTLTNPDQDKSYVFNNMFFNCENPTLGNGGMTPGAINHDYNAFYQCSGAISEEVWGEISSRNPFVNLERSDYHLALSTKGGKILPAPFSTDFDNRTRGADGIWDKGAFEYVANGGTELVPPSNLRISSTK